MTEQSLQTLREEYRSAFALFAQAIDHLLSLRQSGETDCREMEAAEARVEKAQAACREARDKLAAVLLERRSPRLRPRPAPEIRNASV